MTTGRGFALGMGIWLLLLLLARAAQTQAPPCFFEVRADGNVKTQGRSFRSILNGLFVHSPEDAARALKEKSLQAAVKGRVPDDEAVVFVWHYRFCPALIFDRQVDFREFVWAKRAAAILVVDRDFSDEVVKRKLEILKYGPNFNRRVDFPIFLLRVSDATASHRCGMGPLYERLFATGIENNFRVKETGTADGRPHFSITMIKPGE